MKYELDPETVERLEAYVYYYRNHGVENILISHKYFLVDDMEKILDIITDMLEI